MSKFRERLESGEFLVTVEASPPKGTETADFLAMLGKLAGRVDAINLPDSRAANIHLGPLAASILAKEKGLEPILTISCRDRNRIAISADLLGAYVLGIDTILCVSGDYVSFGDAPQAKPVYDLDSVQAIKMIRGMEAGEDIGGNVLKGTPRFCVGCVANPVADPFEPHLLKLEKKLAVGVDFIQTLDIYDLNAAAPFLDYVRDKGIKALAGLRLVTKRDVDLWENRRLPGNDIPREIISEVKEAPTEEEALQKSRARLVTMLKEIRASNMWAGAHITMEGHEDLIPQILTEAGLGR
ncbi:MAG: methylenetetrahydrofolate reductase [Deltaproteobacteria bacterium]|nr:methylenetetrahydrofolate reductase [Deltaproteobacteria bacterium]MBW1927989.1 methylenetetrahydrofolate reductase [Deltaproteobacteria bacterium]MBW2024150.1 methylenetetrahydrofolate reductase [Deltaproteobacteria bacterium]MBW2124432.1 methylenetetrahydrofolate reductase [Deltaproteobacteria bacterium]RLB16600.1 MAG: 5,10-methylenetetrahydrofolate reductase [Deltaproteobacteria bacterium]